MRSGGRAVGVGLGGWVCGVVGRWCGRAVERAVGCLGVFVVLCCENTERHRQAKAHNKEEGRGEMGTDFGASKTLWPSG